MWGFKLKKGKQANLVDPVKSEVLAQKVAFWLIALQLRIAGELNRRMARLPLKSRMLLLFSIGFLLAACFLKVLLCAIF